MKSRSLSVSARYNSLRFAVNGIVGFFRQETNAWIHFISTLMLGAAILYFHVRGNELIALVIVTGFVWAAEAFNTVIERMMDFISPSYHPQVKFIKDLSAGAVLLAACTALLTGAIVFIPKIF
jgi:diacylglycerol kinase (ATP)